MKYKRMQANSNSIYLEEMAGQSYLPPQISNSAIACVQYSVVLLCNVKHLSHCISYLSHRGTDEQRIDKRVEKDESN